jgi:DNA-binding response OmpR family regulator
MLNPKPSKTQILDHVWAYDFNGESGIVESYISYLPEGGLRQLSPIHTARATCCACRLSHDRFFPTSSPA